MKSRASLPSLTTTKIYLGNLCLKIYKDGSSACANVFMEHEFGTSPLASMEIRADGRTIIQRFSASVALVDQLELFDLTTVKAELGPGGNVNA